MAAFRTKQRKIKVDFRTKNEVVKKFLMQEISEKIC